MNSESKHTPGPWTAGRADMATIDPNYGEAKWVYADKTKVAMCAIGDVDDWDVVMANARLIAAAPDMLAALKSMCDRFPYWFPHDSGHCDPAVLALVTKAREAISRAEGKAS